MPNFTMYDREREFKWQIECQLSGGTYAYIDAEDIYSGRITRQISSGEGIEVGSCYVSELDLTIVASALPSNVVSVKPYFRLLTSTEIVDDVVRKYYTPYNLGVFKIASTKRKEYGRIDLVCYDKMADLDTLITPAAYTELLASDWKPFYLLDWIATKVGVTYTFTQSGIEAMPNGTLYFKLAEETSNIKTYRDLLQYVCMLIGAYGIFDEDGHLNVKTFADVTSYSLPASFRFSESFGDVPIVYSGVELTVKNATTMFGNASNTVVRLSDNPFLYTLSNLNQTTDYATFIMQFLRNIYTEFQGLSYYAGEFEIPPDASLNVGRLLAVSGGGASSTINCFLQKIDVNFDGRMMLSCGNPNTYVTRTQNRTTTSITNLTNRIETLESSQGSGGNKIYTSKSAPDNTVGSEGDLWVKYHTENNDKFINSNNEEIDVDIPRYESDNDALSYVDTTIRPILRTIKDTSANKLSGIVKQFEKECTVVLYQARIGMITTSQFPQFAIDTYTVNNQSLSVIQGRDIATISGTAVTSRVIGTEAYNDKFVNVDDFDNALVEDAGNWYVSYYYLYYNTTTKYLNVVSGYLDINWYYHTLPYDTLSTTVTNYSIDLIDTSFAVIDEVYCKINGKWILYEGSGEGGTNVEVTQILTEGTEIAQIDLNGDVVSIYAPTVSATQTQTSGTEIAEINVGDTNTKLYAPTTTVTQVLSSGTEIAQVNGTSLYAPTGGGSDVTVTPITTSGTNIANIAVDGTTYNLFAPSGGGSSGHNYSTTEQVVGTWIDGSTVYERTYDLGSDLTLQESTWTDTGIATPTNANRCIKAEGVQSDGTSTCIMASIASTNITVQSTRNSVDVIRYITIQYTKTS